MGLDAILKGIKEDAEEKCRAIFQEAEEKIAHIEKEWERQRAELEGKLEDEKRRIDIEVRSEYYLPAYLEARSIVINAKRQFIREVVLEAVSELVGSGTSLLGRLVGEIGRTGEKVIVYPTQGSKADIEEYIRRHHLPLEMGDVLDAAQGFILECGRIRYDCTHEAIASRVESKAEEIIVKLLGESK
jgi:vacuolar-type H+-ATPase subunit E/Vma4